MPRRRLFPLVCIPTVVYLIDILRSCILLTSFSRKIVGQNPILIVSVITRYDLGFKTSRYLFHFSNGKSTLISPYSLSVFPFIRYRYRFQRNADRRRRCRRFYKRRHEGPTFFVATTRKGPAHLHDAFFTASLKRLLVNGDASSTITTTIRFVLVNERSRTLLSMQDAM